MMILIQNAKMLEAGTLKQVDVLIQEGKIKSLSLIHI